MNALIALAIIAWLLQLALGGWQLYRFNRAWARLADRGQVSIGRAGAHLQPRVIIAVAVDRHQHITGIIIMRGLSIFAAPQHIDRFNGLPLAKLEPITLFPRSTKGQQAFIQARSGIESAIVKR